MLLFRSRRGCVISATGRNSRAHVASENDRMCAQKLPSLHAIRGQCKLQPNAVLYSSMISALGASNEWQRALRLLVRMQAETLQLEPQL